MTTRKTAIWNREKYQNTIAYGAQESNKTSHTAQHVQLLIHAICPLVHSLDLSRPDLNNSWWRRKFNLQNPAWL